MDILRTYYYDYHCLRISHQTSQIMLEADKMELEDAINNNGGDKVDAINRKIDARTKIVAKQELLLNNMSKVINGLPKQFNGIDHVVFQLRYMQGMTPEAIATQLCYSENYIYKISSKIIDKFGEYLKNTKEES